MPVKHRHAPQSPESIQEWKELSRLTVRARLFNVRDKATEELRKAAEADPKGFFSPAYLLWTADNFEQEGRFEEAAEALGAIAATHGDRPVPFAAARAGGLALQRQAESYQRLGQWDDAAAAFESASKFAGGPAKDELHYAVGRNAERAGRHDQALASYRKAKGGRRGGSEWSPGELAARAAARLENPGHIERDPELLAIALARALSKKDEKTLRSLASPTHFTVGLACGEREFVEYEKVALLLTRSLKVSSVKVDPARLTGSGEKRYLETDGWSGAPIVGTAWFLLTKEIDGWSWSGVVLSGATHETYELVPPIERMDNQPLAMTIRAPWASGLCFRAGGLDRYLEHFIPFWGIGIFLADVGSPCGFGPGGYYYNAAFSHNGADAFAIDFTRYVPHFPYVDLANNQLVLACQEGMVNMVRSTLPSGSTANDNRVEILHWTPAEPLSCGGPPARYLSKYLHLAGPGQIPVSPFMWANQGTPLGRMDDTGNSALPHLHFSVHDRNLGFNSVRPSPMDGQSLNDGDKGRCVCSSNVPSP